ncbi:MAG: hypothetical protein BAA03_02065 [Caldibacillus debilis]|nr:MAG: hypothetical protein BAA03_02065 [Caldibacillus debilis]
MPFFSIEIGLKDEKVVKKKRPADFRFFLQNLFLCLSRYRFPPSLNISGRGYVLRFFGWRVLSLFAF